MKLSGLVPIDVSYVKEWSKDEVSTRTASTLDLCSFSSFALITQTSEDWSHCFANLKASTGKRGIDVRHFMEGTDFDFAFDKQRELFGKEGKLQDGGAILIRPDQHILAIYDAKTSANEVETSILKHLALL
jgi:hypothetical protein